jgi:hypothetical protein
VAGYTITIRSNDDEAGAHTTIKVDTTSGNPRITELTVRAAEGGTISPQQLPALNLDQLIAALVPSETAAITAMPSSTEQVPAPQASNEHPSASDVSAPDVSVSDVSLSEVPTPGAEVAPETPETPQPTASPVRTGRPSRVKKAARTAPAKKATSRSRQTKADRTATATAQSAGDRRAYRRMPEPGDVLAAYREVGGTTALARHYGVPRHTATGWLRRLRNQGMLES